MQGVRIDEIDPAIAAPAVKRSLSTALDTENLALNYYELDPGETISFGYHAHADQEEVYYVQSGTIAFETDGGEVSAVGPAAVRSPPGEFKQGRNAGEDRAVVLAVGAPRDMGETEIRRLCPECDGRTEQTIRVVDDEVPPSVLQTATAGEHVIALSCVECGTETGRFE